MVFRVDATVQRGVDAQSADAIVGSNGQLVPAKWKKKAAASTMVKVGATGSQQDRLGEDSRGCVKYSTDTVQKAEHRTTRAAARRARDWYSNRGSIHGEPRRPREEALALGVAKAARHHQRSAAIHSSVVYVCAAIEQEVRTLGMTRDDRSHQCSAALRIDVVCVGASLEQEARALGVPLNDRKH
eukprot:CAMPEP_0179894826 /NCGR_PEP_ID=MMETSP0982-20121206/35492_1 /TAXON_ID=483367 /ORGANISM="non described non described, Strain CCMP 2436" /LENGTH=184 /DNA_ID=CAMNT_0021791441 /DNA_START=147 /DNA_END=703 /DNA_ORIENTATION=+